MGAGGPGDHPLKDVTYFNMAVYNPRCDELIRQLHKLVPLEELYEMFDWFAYWGSADNDNLDEFEQLLQKKIDEYSK